MKMHRMIVTTFALFALSLAIGTIVVGCEEWKHTGPRYPANSNAEQSGMGNSEWRATGGQTSSTTQP